MKKRLTTKIIAGKYKGRKLDLPPLTTTRSSKNILREALFNILQNEIFEQNFIEVFGGSGSVGLEALSRGAKRSYFIEKNSQSYNVLQNNVKNIDPKASYLFYGDAFEKIWDIVDELKRKKEVAYFYFDPPFSIREGFEDIYEKVIQTIAKLPKEVTKEVIIEHMSKFELPKSIGPYKLYKKRKFGKSTLSFYR